MSRDNLETTGDESVPACLLVLSLLMSLRRYDVLTKATATAAKTSYERDFAFFETSEGYFSSLTLSNVSELSWSLSPKINIHVQKEKKIFKRLSLIVRVNVVLNRTVVADSD